MSTNRNSARLVVLFLIGIAGGALAQEDEWKASKREAFLLPQFCWRQMMGGDVRGPQYEIPKTCGVGMNHYCLGLLKIVRANKTFGKLNHKRGLLRGARDNTLSTLTAMKDHPQCSIRGHAERTLEQIETQLRALN
jgi:hypothetical protein